MPFLRRGFGEIVLVFSPAKTEALPLKSHIPRVEEISLLVCVDVQTAKGGSVMVVGVPIGTEEYVVERAKGLRHGLPGALPGRHARQASGRPHCHLISRIENLRPRVYHDTGSPLEPCGKTGNGYNGLLSTSLSHGKAPRHNP